MGYPYIGNAYDGIDAEHESAEIEADALEDTMQKIDEENRALILGAVDSTSPVMTRFGLLALKTILHEDPELLDMIAQKILNEDELYELAQKRLKNEHEEDQLMKAGL